MNSNNFDKEKKSLITFFNKKKFLDVLKNGTKLLKQAPNNTQIIRILGITSINIQNFIEAEKYFKKLVLIEKNAENYYTLGIIQKKNNKFHEAVISFENAITKNPNFSEAHNNLGNTKKSLNKKDEAIYHYKKAISLKNENIAALVNLSTILKENNNYEELLEVYEKILNLDPKNIKTLYNLGTAHLFLGNTSKAKEYFENTIKIDPSNIPTFRNYVSTIKIDESNRIFKSFKNLNMSTIKYENKILLLDALSKCYFDMDKTEKAFDCLDKCNLLKKENSNFSMKEQEDLFKKIKYFFSDVNKKNLGINDKIKSKPIFIVGMPRSGTSLLEQILSTHSKIYGAGELNYLQKIIDKLGFEKPNNLQSYFNEIRKYYYDQISIISNSEFIIDKLPSNFRWIGFIIKAFPEAKIIHIQRNPMAVCWSNYKNFFVDNGLDFNLTQSDVAQYYSMYLNLMDFWKAKYKNNIVEIQYEIFVKNFESNTKKILEYLNLQWEDQLLQYQKTNRPVTTASHQQVREKIKMNTSEEWKKYKNYLEPMQEVLRNKNIKY
ncbi:MAG: sulfotransferase family protein [Flavobacteriales bacterium TMED235]|nr:MAG: sulfotransferase family protein [Flavobacteriales bacterium TMED235]